MTKPGDAPADAPADEGARLPPAKRAFFARGSEAQKVATTATGGALGAFPGADDPPTGELCGSVFWTLFNQRFHRLFPDNETFVGEIERSVMNVALAAISPPGVNAGGQGPGGTGIRYFQNLSKQKQFASFHATCCEGQGTRLFGLLPELVFSLAPAGVYVDLLADAQLAFSAAPALDPAARTLSLSMETAWP
jgi:uncharacterized protein